MGYFGWLVAENLRNFIGIIYELEKKAMGEEHQQCDEDRVGYREAEDGKKDFIGGSAMRVHLDILRDTMLL